MCVPVVHRPVPPDVRLGHHDGTVGAGAHTVVRAGNAAVANDVAVVAAAQSFAVVVVVVVVSVAPVLSFPFPSELSEPPCKYNSSFNLVSCF